MVQLPSHLTHFQFQYKEFTQQEGLRERSSSGEKRSKGDTGKNN
jgi:hypothetical protein